MKSLSLMVQKLKQRWILQQTDRHTNWTNQYPHVMIIRSRSIKNSTEWNQKQQHFITHASRSLLWIWFVAVAFQSEEVFWRRGPPVTYFASPWIRPWANMAKTSLCMCRAMSTSSLPSFVNIHPFCSKGWLCVPIHMHALVQPPPPFT